MSDYTRGLLTGLIIALVLWLNSCATLDKASRYADTEQRTFYEPVQKVWCVKTEEGGLSCQ